MTMRADGARSLAATTQAGGRDTPANPPAEAERPLPRDSRPSGPVAAINGTRWLRQLDWALRQHTRDDGSDKRRFR